MSSQMATVEVFVIQSSWPNTASQDVDLRPEFAPVLATDGNGWKQ